MTRRQYITWFVRDLGGVAGVVRRIIRQWRGVFTWGFIYQEFCRLHPIIDPNRFQLQDVIGDLVRWGRIVCVFWNGNGAVYRRL